jgi:hypothetical protein
MRYINVEVNGYRAGLRINIRAVERAKQLEIKGMDRDDNMSI